MVILNLWLVGKSKPHRRAKGKLTACEYGGCKGFSSSMLLQYREGPAEVALT